MRYPLHNETAPPAAISSSPGVYAWASEKTLNTCVPLAACQPVPSRRRPGFTLIEMLITITIIGILAGAVLAALQGARETAKAAKTKSTITKLHYIMMARYDEYRSRRVPLDVKEYVANHDGNPGTEINYYSALVLSNRLSVAFAHARLMAIRDLMRMEMPDRRSDLDELVIKPTPPDVLTVTPSITNRYLRLYNQAAAVGNDPSAEFLYMTVMSIPEAAEQFNSTEIADTDGNGLPEFIDGWGRPIKFIRWPVGFLKDGSVVNTTPPITITHGAITDLQEVNTQDPFDPLNLSGGYAVYPLIYSAGPDGGYDINTGWGYQYLLDATGSINPYTPDSDGYLIGQPLRRDASGVAEAPDPERLRHYDNINNHMLEVR